MRTRLSRKSLISSSGRATRRAPTPGSQTRSSGTRSALRASPAALIPSGPDRSPLVLASTKSEVPRADTRGRNAASQEASDYRLRLSLVGAIVGAAPRTTRAVGAGRNGRLITGPRGPVMREGFSWLKTAMVRGMAVATLRRGDIVVAAAPGDYGKPRPAIVVQSDLFNDTHPSIVVCLVTTHLVAAPLFRIAVEPTRETGLRERSQIMVDKITTLRRERLRNTIGRLDRKTLGELDRALIVFFGLV